MKYVNFRTKDYYVRGSWRHTEEKCQALISNIRKLGYRARLVLTENDLFGGNRDPKNLFSYQTYTRFAYQCSDQVISEIENPPIVLKDRNS